MNGTGTIRKVDYDQECGHCNKLIPKKSDYVYYHKGNYSVRWVMPVCVKCYKELQHEV